MKLHYILLIVFVCLFSSEIYAQNEKEYVRDSTVLLKQILNRTQIVVLWENEEFIIKASYVDVEAYMNWWVEHYPNNKGDKMLLDSIRAYADMQGDIHADKIAKSNALQNRLLYEIADLLSNGKCLVQYKKSDTIAREITLQYYEAFDVAGRRFYINKTLLFQTVEEIF